MIIFGPFSDRRGFTIEYLNSLISFVLIRHLQLTAPANEKDKCSSVTTLITCWGYKLGGTHGGGNNLFMTFMTVVSLAIFPLGEPLLPTIPCGLSPKTHG